MSPENKKMVKEYDVVKAKIDLTNEIKKHTNGVILSVYEDGKYFLVEFINENKETIGDGMTLVKLEDLDLVYDYPSQSE